jgi:PPIC-type PPIASE domain
MLAVASLGSLSSCTTFSDDNVAARVNDTELKNDDLSDILRSVEGEEATFAPINDASRTDDATDIIRNWIVDQIVRDDLANNGIVVPAPSTELSSAAIEANFNESATLWQQQPPITISDEEARAEYERGPLDSSMICPSYIIVESAELADDIYSQITDGSITFAEAAAANSLDQATAATGGVIPCDDSRNFVDQFQEVPELVNAAFEAEIGEVTEPFNVGEVYVLMRLRPWEELEPGELDPILTSVPTRFDFLTRQYDVYVDPRFGSFDGSLGLVPLG